MAFHYGGGGGGGGDQGGRGCTEGVDDGDDWCLIESDPAVFTELLEQLGCRCVECVELYSLDDDDVVWRAMCEAGAAPTTPHQCGCYGLIFLFEWNAAAEQQNAAQQQQRTAAAAAAASTSASSASNSAAIAAPHNDNPTPMVTDDADAAAADGRSSSSGAVPAQLFFAHQVTTNACATQALLSVVLTAANAGRLADSSSSDNDTNCNSNDAAAAADLGPVLSAFRAFTAEFPPALKGVAVSGSPELRAAHNSFAPPDAHVYGTDGRKRKKANIPGGEAFHFIAYVPVDGTVYELDGLQAAPVAVARYDTDDGGSKDSGGKDDDDRRWLSVARGAVLERMRATGADAGAVKYNLMAVAPDQRLALRARLRAAEAAAVDDDGTATGATSSSDAAALTEALEQLDRKRAAGVLENQRRRHNYTGLAVQVLKELARYNGGRDNDSSNNGGGCQWTALVEAAREKQALRQRRRQREAAAAAARPP